MGRSWEGGGRDRGPPFRDEVREHSVRQTCRVPQEDLYWSLHYITKIQSRKLKPMLRECTFWLVVRPHKHGPMIIMRITPSRGPPPSSIHYGNEHRSWSLLLPFLYVGVGPQSHMGISPHIYDGHRLIPDHYGAEKKSLRKVLCESCIAGTR